MRSYPNELVHEVHLDGTGYGVRPIRPEDGTQLAAFHQLLSTRSSYLRFFTFHPELSIAEIERFTNVDYDDRLALVVECEGQLVAVGRYDRLPNSTEAEVAFVVTDEFQHRGLAMLLLDDLAGAALSRGITSFVASTLAENRAMRSVFSRSGFDVLSDRDHETVTVRFSIKPADRYREALAERRSAMVVPPSPVRAYGPPTC